eukprot:SAG11_NODE_30614_length_299_cov_1.000000_1_plen_62_part_10
MAFGAAPAPPSYGAELEASRRVQPKLAPSRKRLALIQLALSFLALSALALIAGTRLLFAPAS